MHTIVVDTSVLVAALISQQGINRKVFRKCFLGDYRPLISNALFQEYEDVSARESILAVCPLSADEIRQFLNAFYKVCKWTPIYYLWRPNLKDEADNFLIELAIAGNADCIVTNNAKDIKAAELRFKGLKVFTPKALLGGI